MRTATLLLAAFGPVPLFFSPSLAQPRPLSREQIRQMEADRKATIKELGIALRDRCSDDAAYQMRILVRLYTDDRGAQEIARELVKVLEARFPCEIPKMRALAHLRELGDPGLQELERALLSRLRNQPVPLQLRGISTLVEACRPESYDTLLRLGRDKNQVVAVAAVKSLANWKQLPPEGRRDLAQKVLLLMRPPTAEEVEKALELPALQRALRDVLAELTGKRVHTLPEWRSLVATWIREGCPLPACEEEQKSKQGELAEQKTDGQQQRAQEAPKTEGPPAPHGPPAQTVRSQSTPPVGPASRTSNRR